MNMTNTAINTTKKKTLGQLFFFRVTARLHLHEARAFPNQSFFPRLKKRLRTHETMKSEKKMMYMPDQYVVLYSATKIH